MSPPPATLPLGAFGPAIATLFARAFAPSGEAARPAAREWVDALQDLERELTACIDAPMHFHVRGAACCWCALESGSGVHLFGMSTTAKLGKKAIASLWSAIEAVRRPASDPGYPIPKSLHKVPKPPRWRSRGRWKFFVPVLFVLYGFLLVMTQNAAIYFTVVATFVVGIAALGLWRGLRRMALLAYRAYRNREVNRAGQAWKQLVKRWNEHCSTALFNAEVERLRLAHRELALSENRRGVEMRRLRREHETRARELYLEQFPIEPRDFQLNPAHLATLASFGFETAADVWRKTDVLGQVLDSFTAAKVRAWAMRLHSEYRFDRKSPPDVRLVAEVEQRIAARQRQLLATLRDGPARLEQKRHEILSARARMEPTMDAAWKNLRALRDKADSLSES